MRQQQGTIAMNEMGVEQNKQEPLIYEISDEMLEIAVGTDDGTLGQLHSMAVHCCVFLPGCIARRPVSVRVNLAEGDAFHCYCGTCSPSLAAVNAVNTAGGSSASNLLLSVVQLNFT
jgi:hypothetical protein